ncbi:UDP-N-acetylglucosamine--N-acetylmuramyl-(pentapeptide) pyrophosphoryl-undecaprenol N-acetylglucosamine transferase [Leifsonia poae]|uniref:UDP-N-acetylglucosamine--N-acetylmuramyl- (pentapeptide) pyrophosphoryl-undecaprenol N-acetylglucosamine transferase n=1 Tax=Leifsonia poae TaxID=110933 RepID=UPI001CC1785E|nr:UDP-N-acetylglucosamine--N-acetylmuramyl-(pentapeptide) pyrophosphoryl-undecaprenol N-acetylglucosamine transferase [Leifsonia poae]
MTRYLLAGGGTAGHVNPLLAVADRLRRDDPQAEVLVLGTKEGLEARLVPDRGYELATIPKLPFPRRPNRAALRFPGDYRRSIATVRSLLEERGIDAVVGFGGYASAPAYSAARKAGVPLVLHEANAKPGLANRLGARYTPHVGVAFPDTNLPHARFVGMPLRVEIEQLDRVASRPEALALFDLVDDRPTLLVTGGSLGARRLNRTIADRATELTAAGYQVLHIQGGRGELTDPGIEHYRLLDYCDRMDLAFAVTDFAVARAGAATVCEFAALGVPAVYVPFPVGNGEQRFNAAGVVNAGGGILIDDARFLPGWVDGELLPLLADSDRVAGMGERAASVGVRDGSDRMVSLIRSSL